LPDALSIINPAIAEQKNNDRSTFPGRRIGGGTRGEACIVGSQPLIALNPVNNLGVTASDSPVIHVLMPTLNGTRAVEFVLNNAEGVPVYETTLEIEANQQIASVHLPQNSLKTGQDYQWYFSLACDPQDFTQDVVLTGWLRRISANIAVESQSSWQNRLQQAIALQETGLSTDAIATLVELRQAYPDNAEIEHQWTRILQQLELDNESENARVSQF
jgi:hypothetical protein